jgi:P-type E1-E2 ATPase
MNGTSPEPHDHHHAMPHPADVSATGHEKHGMTGHTGHGEPGAHDRHEGHSVAMCVKAVVEGKEFYMGGPAMVKRLALTPPDSVRQASERAAARGQASIYLLTSTAAVAAFSVADAVRPESRDAIQRLQEQGIEVVMLTGDAKTVAAAVAADLGIDTVFAEVLPGEKVDKIKELKAQGKRVTMVVMA